MQRAAQQPTDGRPVRSQLLSSKQHHPRAGDFDIGSEVWVPRIHGKRRFGSWCVVKARNNGCLIVDVPTVDDEAEEPLQSVPMTLLQSEAEKHAAGPAGAVLTQLRELTAKHAALQSELHATKAKVRILEAAAAGAAGTIVVHNKKRPLAHAAKAEEEEVAISPPSDASGTAMVVWTARAGRARKRRCRPRGEDDQEEEDAAEPAPASQHSVSTRHCTKHEHCTRKNRHPGCCKIRPPLDSGGSLQDGEADDDVAIVESDEADGLAEEEEEEEEGDDEVVATWSKLALRCGITMGALTDPARLSGCAHRGLCNFTALRGRHDRRCPIAGCPATLKRCGDLVRDNALRATIKALPPNQREHVWVHADGERVRTSPPKGCGGRR